MVEASSEIIQLSGICGVWATTGSDLNLDTLVDGIAYRARDGIQIWAEGSVGLGNALLATTSEAASTRGLFQDTASGRVITADARLDNRYDLIQKLGLAESIGEPELILRAYERWGTQSASRFLGDFAFAIWDPTEQRMFCARDHIGLRPFYYFTSEFGFLFASDFDAVVAHPSVEKAISWERIGDFLDDREGADFDSTLHPNVFRLPPAHFLCVENRETVLTRYWNLEAPLKLELADDDAYAAAFREVFVEAVRARIRGLDPIGCMLSGGIDSASVAAVAADELLAAERPRLRTFSAASESEDCEESQRIATSASSDKIASHRIYAENLGAHGDRLRDLLVNTGEPFDCWMSLVRSVYALAEENGVKIVLDGVGGDVAFIRGNPVAERLAQLRLREALKELNHQNAFLPTEEGRMRRVLAASWAAFAPNWLRRVSRSLTASDTEVQNGITGMHVTLDFARQAKIGVRRRAHFREIFGTRPFGPAYRASIMSSPAMTAGRERYERSAARFGIEPRDPFLDVRVLTFCLSLPSEQLTRHGWPKFLLRKSMAGRVKEAVLWALGKYHLGPKFTDAVMLKPGLPSPSASELPFSIAAMVDVSEWNRHDEARTRRDLHPLISLSFWLNRCK